MVFSSTNPFKTMSKAPRKKRSSDQGKNRARWESLAQELEEIKLENQVSLPGTWTVEDYRYLIDAIVELVSRQSEALDLYVPLPTGKQFHYCLAHEVAISGANRAGKTTTIAAEVAMAAMGRHYIESKYPKEGMQIAAIGYDGRHLSLMYEYLFEKPPFQVYQHPVTFQWRVVEEDNPECQQYRHLWQDGQPMIPERMVKQVSWEDKKEKIPKTIRLYNGTVIRFYSGLVRGVPKGRKFHLVWLDEELDDPGRWLKEMRARIIDLNGRIYWSATPQRATEEFYDFEMRANQPENATKPINEQTGFFLMLSTENKYLSQPGNVAFMNKLKGDDEEMRTRFFGQSSRGYFTVYPEYGTHNLVGQNTEHFQLWYEDTRYIIIDPGVDTCAVLFCACPAQAKPNQIPKLTEEEKLYRTRLDCIVCYDELKIRQCNPEMMADAVKRKLAEYPTSWIQDFTIDEKGGKSIVWRGMQESCEKEYWKALQKYEIHARENDWWKYGSSDKNLGVRKTQGFLLKDFDGFPRLFIHRRCKELMWEFRYWKKKRAPNGEFVGYEDKNNHLLDCLRYAITREIRWVPPPEPLNKLSLSQSEIEKAMRDIRSGASFYRS